MSLLAKAIVLSALLLQYDDSVTPFKGKGLEGGGRACNGSLRIYPQFIDYETSFSTCDHMAYKTLRTATHGPWVYQFTRKKKGCLAEVLEVKYVSGAWDVLGWESVAAWRKHGTMHVTECLIF